MRQPTITPVGEEALVGLVFFTIMMAAPACGAAVGRGEGAGEGTCVGANVGGCWTTRPEAATPPDGTEALATAAAPGTACAAAFKFVVNCPNG